jgi:hypothetical protein
MESRREEAPLTALFFWRLSVYTEERGGSGERVNQIDSMKQIDPTDV